MRIIKLKLQENLQWKCPLCKNINDGNEIDLSMDGYIIRCSWCEKQFEIQLKQ